MKKSSYFLIAAGLSTAFAASLNAQPQLRPDNIDEVVAAMTLEEKAALLTGDAWGTRNPVSATDGSDYPSGPVYVPGAPFSTRPIPRLGITATGMSDGPAGIRFNISREGTDKLYYATSFPVGTVMASTWNTELVNELTTAMGDEVLKYGVDVILGPGMDIHRNPLCGRNFEYFSEDPFLSGKIAASWVNGVQSNGVGVSAKHFAANDQETNRFYSDSRMNPRALREIALKGFEIMVKESQPWTIMSSYNKINGTFTQQDYGLLQTILRDEWGYTGVVITDWGYKEGTVAAVKAGNDLMEAGMAYEADRIVAAVKDGTLSMDDVDRNVRRVLQYVVKTPRYRGYKYDENPDLDAHARLVRTAAAEGLVLLKNDGVTLPFDGVRSVALYGLSSYDMIAGGTGSGNVNKKYIRQLDEGFAEDGIGVDEDIQKWYKDYITFTKTDLAAKADKGRGVLLGSAVIPDPEIPASLIGGKVEKNDIAVITIGRNAGEGGDRTFTSGDWYLTGTERDLLQDVADAYHAAGKKVVVVLNIGGVIETASWKDIPDAILLAWTPGQEVGYTVADVLTGKSYPSGKLPMTFANSYLDIPSSHNFPYNYDGGMTMYLDNGMNGNTQKELRKDVDYTTYAEGIWVGYRYFSTAGKAVSYPFGYGLSYTAFSYSNPTVKLSGDKVTATIEVRNIGKAAGKEAVQVYVTAPDGGLVKPDFELKGFAKTRELAPGESQKLTIVMDAYDLASFNEDASEWQTAAGTYTVNFAASAADFRQKATFKMPKALTWVANRVCLPETPVQEITVK